LRLISVRDYRRNHYLDLIMDAQKSYAVAFLVGEGEVKSEDDEVVRAPSPSSLE
jgi:hypothetical protein